MASPVGVSYGGVIPSKSYSVDGTYNAGPVRSQFEVANNVSGQNLINRGNQQAQQLVAESMRPVSGGDVVGGGWGAPNAFAPVQSPMARPQPWAGAQNRGSMQDYIANLLTRYGGGQRPAATSPMRSFTPPTSGMANTSGLTGLLNNPTFGSSMRYK